MDFSNVVATYGLQATTVALVTILLIGIVKVVFKKGLVKLGSAAAKSLYEAMSALFAFGLTIAWTCIAVYCLHWDILLSWKSFLADGAVTYAAVKVVYPMYENYHLRDLFKMIGSAIVDLFKKMAKEQAVKKQAKLRAKQAEINAAKSANGSNNNDPEVVVKKPVKYISK